jgi:hypothetical protein
MAKIVNDCHNAIEALLGCGNDSKSSHLLLGKHSKEKSTVIFVFLLEA